MTNLNKDNTFKNSSSISLSITTSQINSYYTNAREKAINLQNYYNNSNFADTQYVIETTLIKQNHPCPIQHLSNLQNHISEVNPEEFKTLVGHNFYDPAVMKSALCLAESIFFPQPIQKGSISSNQRIKEWFKSLQQIGDPSIQGYAMKADFDRAKDMFVLKTSRSSENDKGMVHELYVGFILNQLRAYIPNFAYVFGGFSCSIPIFDDKSVISWCNNKNPVQYVLYENIVPSISMKELCKFCSFSKFLNIYLQVLYSIRLAHNMFDFTHYDLHTDNVLIRQIGNGTDLFSIPYSTENSKIEYILTDRIATIIDYGLSHIKYDNKHFGEWLFQPYGIYPDRSHPLHDAYKLLGFSLYYMRLYKNMVCYDQAIKLLYFFNKSDNLDEIIEKQINTMYFLPLIEYVDQFSIDDYIRYIRETCVETQNIIFPTPKSAGSRVLGCHVTDMCFTNNDSVYRKLGISEAIEINTIYDFYDIVSRLNDEGDTIEVSRIVETFNFDNALNYANDKIGNMSDELNKHPVIDTLSITGLGFNDLIDEDLIKRYKASINKIIVLYNLSQDYAILANAIIFTSSYYERYDIMEYYENNLNTINELFVDLLRAINHIITDIDSVNSFATTHKQAIDGYIATKNPAAWWWTGFQTYKTVF
jgi:hypothetical protein